MKFKQSSVRPRGQRSIATSFLIRGAKGSDDCNASLEIKPPAKKGSGLSLSDFLNRKLHKGSVLPNSATRKEVGSSSSLTGGVGEMFRKNGGKEKASLSLDAGVFDLFKNVEKSAISVADDNCGNGIDSLGVNKKRKCDDDKLSGRKVVAVIGEDSEATHGGKRKGLVRKDERRPFFNHYKSGSGWWDENMEGLDNENVGGTEAWEGVGCTTLGAVEWN